MENNFFLNALTDSINVRNVITIHYFKYAKNFSVAGESHDFYEAVFVDSGNVTVTDVDTVHILHQGQAFLHAPNAFHNLKANNEYSNIIIFTFDCGNLPDGIAGKIYNMDAADKHIISEIVGEGAASFSEPLDIVELTKMNLRAELPFGSLQIIKNNIERFLISLVRKAEKIGGALPPHTARDSIYRDITAYLFANLNRNITLDDISHAVGYSKVYLKKVFHSVCGGSIINSHLKMKIEEAKKLIAEDNNFDDISETLGFNTPQYFSFMFRKFTNMTPTAYRNSVKLKKLL